MLLGTRLLAQCLLGQECELPPLSAVVMYKFGPWFTLSFGANLILQSSSSRKTFLKIEKAEVLAKEWWKSKSIKFNCCLCFSCLFASLQVWFYCVSSWVHAGLLNHLTSCLLTCFCPEVEWACHAGVVIHCWEFNWDTDLHSEYPNYPSVSFPHMYLAFTAGWGKQLLSCRAALI